MQYNKLVRDRIPEIIEQSGSKAEYSVMEDEEYRASLRAKVLEEAHEVQAAITEELALEIADLYEVLTALMQAHNIKESTVRILAEERRASRGAFHRKIKLISVED